jgi:hypothetical protein
MSRNHHIITVDDMTGWRVVRTEFENISRTVISLYINKIGKVFSVEHTKVPKVFFTPLTGGMIADSSYGCW